MTVTETRNAAVAFMEAMAADDTHGYDQASRWGPDYDCSSLVISAWKKAVDTMSSATVRFLQREIV